MRFFPAVLAFVCFAVFYYFVLRRVLLDTVRFRIFALRDELRRKAIEGKVKPTSFEFRHLERVLCNLVSVAPHLNIYHFGQFVIWQRHMPVPSREVRFKEVAAPDLIRLEAKAVKVLFWVLLINSPTGAVLLGLASLFMVIAAAINSKRKAWIARIRRQLEEQGREFLDQDLATPSSLANAYSHSSPQRVSV